jgi:hypothetical protein
MTKAEIFLFAHRIRHPSWRITFRIRHLAPPWLAMCANSTCVGNLTLLQAGIRLRNLSMSFPRFTFLSLLRVTSINSFRAGSVEARKALASQNSRGDGDPIGRCLLFSVPQTMCAFNTRKHYSRGIRRRTPKTLCHHRGTLRAPSSTYIPISRFSALQTALCEVVLQVKSVQFREGVAV